MKMVFNFLRESRFLAPPCSILDGMTHNRHAEQASMIRRSIRRRNQHAHDRALRGLVKRSNVAWQGTTSDLTNGLSLATDLTDSFDKCS
jgi:hypothetical protein